MSLGSSMDADAPVESKKKGIPVWARLGVAAVVVGGVIFLLRTVEVLPRLQGAIEWVHGLGALGIVVFAGLYVIATLIGLATPLTMAGGVVYGVVGGVAIVSPSSVLAATIAFLLGRTVLRKSVEEKVKGNRKFTAIERAVSKNGFKIVGLLRLSPAIPFTILNYSLGLTSVRLRDFVLASFLGMLPGTVLYIYIGHSIGDVAAIVGGAADLSEAEKAGFFAQYGKTLLLGIGLLATAAVTIYVTKIARGALREELNEQVPGTPVD